MLPVTLNSCDLITGWLCMDWESCSQSPSWGWTKTDTAMVALHPCLLSGRTHIRFVLVCLQRTATTSSDPMVHVAPLNVALGWKEGMQKPIDRVLETWCDCAETEVNPRQENGRTAGPNFSARPGQQTKGSPRLVKNATDHHAQAFIYIYFYFCHGCRRRAKQSPEVSIISLRPRGQEKSHYICCHTKSLSRCGGESAQSLWCDAG